MRNRIIVTDDLQTSKAPFESKAQGMHRLIHEHWYRTDAWL